MDTIPVFCIAVYDEGMKAAISALKFERTLAILPVLQQLILDHFPDVWRDADLLLPVPISVQRRKERGFNQCERLLEPLSRALNLPLITNAIVRGKETRPLYTLTEEERKAEVQGVFSLANPALIAGKKILLFDDIVTTGTTITEMTRLLASAGAREIYVLGLSKTVLRQALSF